jgi:hypothetical protein
VLITLEYLAAVLILLIDPVRFSVFLSNSHINLTLLNRVFISITGLFSLSPVKYAVMSLITICFAGIMIYFTIIKHIWLRPVKEAYSLSFITTVSTIIFCLLAINFWQIYTNFM